MYAAGWVARGPVGVIASTMHDAYTLSSLVLQDHFGDPASSSSDFLVIDAGALEENTSAEKRSSVEPGLPPQVERGIREGKVVTLDKWLMIDRAETERGKTKGKEREKFTTVEEMLEVI